jgi:hypothetical protein
MNRKSANYNNNNNNNNNNNKSQTKGHQNRFDQTKNNSFLNHLDYDANNKTATSAATNENKTSSRKNNNNNNNNTQSLVHSNPKPEKSTTPLFTLQGETFENSISSQQGCNGTATSSINPNFKYQPAPFQPPAYHQKPKQQSFHHHQHQHQHQQQQQQNKSKILVEKYDKKYNLISFILLRKKDEFLHDNKFYLNDQSLYMKIEDYIERGCLKSLKSLFLNKKCVGSEELVNLANFTNSYNCNLFVYTIRKCLESFEPSHAFTTDLIRFLFSQGIRPFSFYLLDGDFPKRNLMHYAARYNCDLIPRLLLESFNNNPVVKQHIKTSVIDKEDEEKLSHLLHEDSCIITSVSESAPSAESLLHKAKAEILTMHNGQFVLAQLCMQRDFNDNTPIHLACQNNAYNFIKRVNPICVQHSQLLANEDGLNPFLLASRHSSVKLLKHLCLAIEQAATQAAVQAAQNTNALYISNLICVSVNSELKQLLVSVDKINSKNCLHYACGRGRGKDALNVVKYLTSLAQKLDKESASHQVQTFDANNNNSMQPAANQAPIFYQLIGSVSPLVGSVYHVAASNLTRLTTLWYLLNLYPQNDIFLDNLDKTSVLNKLDFREFTTVDCLFDSVMNLREMAPPNYKSLARFYSELLSSSSSPPPTTTTTTTTTTEFNVLLLRCLFKLVVDFRVKILNLPRITNQLQLIEFLKLLVFMSKFAHQNEAGNFGPIKVNNNQGNHENEFKGFEAFCVQFFDTFVFRTGSPADTLDLIIPLFVTNNNIINSSQVTCSANNETENKKCKKPNNKLNQSNNNNSKQKGLVLDRPEELTNLFDILTHMCSLADIVLFSSAYSQTFKTHLFSYLKSYLNSLTIFVCNSSLNSSSSFTFTQQLNQLKIKIDHMVGFKTRQFTLKNLCRFKVNSSLKSKFSALSRDYVYFKLPEQYLKMANFLTFGLVNDLYGNNLRFSQFREQ